MKNYISLIIDMEKSRNYDIDERNDIQHYMTQCVSWLNQLFATSIERKVTFSAGDELQGLFRNVQTALMFFRILEIMVNPVCLRVGIGIGAWTVKVEEGSSTQQDGPAYHLAREGIQEVHKKQLHNIRIVQENEDHMLNHLFNASMILKREQVYMQNVVLTMLELLYPFVQKNEKVCDEEIIKQLLLLKFNYKLKTSKGRAEYDLETIKLKHLIKLQPIRITGIIGETEDAITVRNTSKVISEILACSRQNVDLLLKRGNSYKIRELDYMALQYAENVYGGV